MKGINVIRLSNFDGWKPSTSSTGEPGNIYAGEVRMDDNAQYFVSRCYNGVVDYIFIGSKDESYTGRISVEEFQELRLVRRGSKELDTMLRGFTDHANAIFQ